jgi:DNA topoisomerase-1
MSNRSNNNNNSNDFSKWYKRIIIGNETVNKIVRGKNKAIHKPIYIYVDRHGNEITNKEELSRINNIVIPHAYHDVYINPNRDGKIQAIGMDNMNRSQYIYNKEYVIIRNEEKYCHMIEFGKILPYLISDIDKIIRYGAQNINRPTKDFMVALTLKIMFLCNFRIGNKTYETKYKTKGTTTLSANNIKILTDHILINFVGKKGVINKCLIYEDEIYDILGKIYADTTKNKNKYIFYYYDDNASALKNVKSSDINDFLSQYGEFTSKNLRTWIANYLLTEFLVEAGPCNTVKDCSRNIKNAISYVSERLHHTPAICRKSYIDRYIIDTYMNNIRWRNNVLNYYHKSGIYNATHNLLLHLFTDSCEL